MQKILTNNHLIKHLLNKTNPLLRTKIKAKNKILIQNKIIIQNKIMIQNNLSNKMKNNNLYIHKKFNLKIPKKILLKTYKIIIKIFRIRIQKNNNTKISNLMKIHNMITTKLPPLLKISHLKYPLLYKKKSHTILSMLRQNNLMIIIDQNTHIIIDLTEK